MFNLCRNYTIPGLTCASNEEILSILKHGEVYGAVYFQDQAINLKQFKNYASSRTTYKFELIAPDEKIYHDINIKPIEIQVVSGLFGTDESTYSFYSYDYTLDSIGPAKSGEGLVLFSFYTSDNKSNYYLTYISILDVVSNVGGLMQILMAIATILVPLYTSRERDIETLNQIFSFYSSTSQNIEDTHKKKFVHMLHYIKNSFL